MRCQWALVVATTVVTCHVASVWCESANLEEPLIRGPHEKLRFRGKSNWWPRVRKFRTDDAKKYYNNPKGAKITKSSHFNYQYELGHKIVFLCVAKGSPLPHITWFKDGVEIYAHNYMQLHEWRVGNRLKSKMEIDPATQADAGIYECHANNKFAVDVCSFRTTYVSDSKR